MEQTGSLPVVPILMFLAIVIFEIAALWRLFIKAGQPGWAAIVPIYNAYVMLKVAGKPGWWLLLFLIPLANFVFLILTMIGLAAAFGKGTGFAVGLILLNAIFIPVLAFGDAEFQGASG